MRRTTISLGDALLKRLHRAAEEHDTSVAAIVREAVEEKLDSLRPRPRSLGAGASNYTDTARRSGDIRPEPRSWR